MGDCKRQKGLPSAHHAVARICSGGSCSCSASSGSTETYAIRFLCSDSHSTQVLEATHTVSCAAVVTALLASSQQIGVLLPHLRATHEQYRGAEQAVQQRLGWSASSNRQLAVALADFSTAVTARTQATLNLARMCTMTSSLASTLSHLETYRSNSAEVAKLDASSLSLVTTLRGQLERQEDCRARLSVALRPLPPQLVALAPQGHISAGWLNERAANIPALIAEAQVSCQIHQAAALSAVPHLTAPCSRLQLMQDSISELMSELQPLLDPLVRAGSRQACAATLAHQKLAVALSTASGCCDELAAAAHNGLSGGVSIALDQQASDLPALADGFMQSVSALAALQGVEGPGDDGQVVAGKDEPDASPLVAEQERNAQATSVWRRVRAKLEGRDIDSRRGAAEPRSVEEQVDVLIRDATADTRLCRMYEGWAPWV